MNKDLLIIRDIIKLLKEDTQVDKVLFAGFLSALVYFSDEFIIKILNELKIENKDIFIHETHNEFKFILIKYENINYVSYRGTMFSTWSNVKKIFNFLPKKNNKGLKIHRGFLMAFNDCNKILYEKIKDDVHPIIFTGHSLGGALALLSTEYYKESAITFASPNVFFMENLNGKIDHIGYKMKGDIVPQIPPSILFLSWKRAAVEIRLYSSKFYFNVLKYHSLATYMSSIKERYESYKINKE